MGWKWGLFFGGFSLVACADSTLNSFLSKTFPSETPGCALMARHNGALVFEKSYGRAVGLRSIIPSLITSETRFRIGSVTKAVLATAVLKLREERLEKGEGDLLDEKLGNRFPFLLSKSVHAGVTVRELLAHTAALQREPNPQWTGFGITDEWTPLYLAAQNQKARLKNASHRDQYAYSNLGYMVLAAWLSYETKKSWRKYLDDVIFSPLQMTDTEIEDPLSLLHDENSAQGYEGDSTNLNEARFDTRGRFLLGSGGVISTGKDLLRFAMAVEQRKILSEESWDLALSPTPQSVAANDAYGLGWSVPATSKPIDEWTAAWHGGSGYGYLTLLESGSREAPSCGVTQVILCNIEKPFLKEKGIPSIYALGKKVRETFCPDIPKSGPVPPPHLGEGVSNLTQRRLRLNRRKQRRH